MEKIEKQINDIKDDIKKQIEYIKDFISSEVFSILTEAVQKVTVDYKHSSLLAVDLFVAFNRFAAATSSCLVYKAHLKSKDVYDIIRITPELYEKIINKKKTLIAYDNDIKRMVLDGIPLSKEIDDTFTGLDVLAIGSSDEKWKDLSNSYLDLLVKYNLTPEIISTAISTLYPNDPSYNEKSKMYISDEIKEILSSITKKKYTKGIMTNIPEFINILFNDDGISYSLDKVIELIIKSNKKSDNKYILDKDKFYSEIRFIANGYIDPINFPKDDEMQNTENPSSDKKDESDDILKNKGLVNLNEIVKENRPILLDVDKTIESIKINLNKRTNKCVSLIGPSGCGKTSVIREFAARINDGTIGEEFKDSIIMELRLSDVIAGCQLVGMFEKKANKILTEVAKRKEIILFIDDAQTILTVGTNNTSGNGESFGNIMKSYINSGSLRVILATTNTGYSAIEKDPAFSNRFSVVRMNQPDDNKTKEILNKIIPANEEFYNCKTGEDLIDGIIKYGPRYIPNKANPRRSIDLLESTFSYANITKGKDSKVTTEDLLKYLEIQYDFKVNKDRVKTTIDSLKENILGQDDAIDRIKKRLVRADLGLVHNDRPRASIIFAGPTGTGKTETALLLAENWSGSRDKIIRIDMSEYSEATAASNLIGTSKGYVGYEDETKLFSQIKQNPNSIVLFDEIEKAHPKIFDLFLQILSTGEATDNKGNTISFKNAIIIFTTNLGFSGSSYKKSSFGIINKDDQNTTRKTVMDSIEKTFRPEFLGRINDIIIYDYLTDDIILKLINKSFNQYKEESDFDITFDLTEDDINKIKENSKLKQYGARYIDDYVGEIIAEKIIELKDKEENTNV